MPDSIKTFFGFVGMVISITILFYPHIKIVSQLPALKDKIFLANFFKDTLTVIFFSLLVCILFFCLVVIGLIPLSSLIQGKVPYVVITGLLFMYGGIGSHFFLRYSKLARQLGLSLVMSVFLIDAIFLWKVGWNFT